MPTLADMLRTAAANFPDQVAVMDPEHSAQLTYRELDLTASDLGKLLVRNGQNAGDRIGICATKSCTSVAALYGTMYGRGAYVPVDVSSPASRIAGILRDCGVRLAFVARSRLDAISEEWEDGAITVVEEMDDDISLVHLDGEVAAVDAHTDPSLDVSYILYTSGSTGKPKGVVHTHRSALAFVDWCSGKLSPRRDDRFSSHAPFHFDLSILDLFVPVRHGAAVVLVGDEVGKQPMRLARFIADAGISIWYSTPSILRMLAEYGKLDSLDFGSLRVILFAGEVFPLKHLRELRRLWPDPRYLNLYGPTETNVCTFYELPSEPNSARSEPYPIGFPCSGDRTIVVDSADRIVPAGDEGELLVSGPSVMREYWNESERTRSAFLVDDEGARWYRTGDIVRESPEDGYIFAGRRDRMVKRRGYRVELGEIEAALYRHPDVAEAAVTAVSDEENGVSVVAYLATVASNAPNTVQMKRFCMNNLPSYMVPDRFFFSDSLPKTSTDKIDYQRLSARS